MDTQAGRYSRCNDDGEPATQSNAYNLAVDTKGRARPTPSNLDKILKFSRAWRPFVWYDAFLDRILIRDGAIREWCDHDDQAALVFLNEHVGMERVTAAHVRAAVGLYVYAHDSRNCVRDWLRALTWDHSPRVNTAFEAYWGAALDENQPEDYVRAASANLFLCMVARVFRPGCQVDNMIVFEGAQGIRKSSALRVLGGAWYAQHSEAVTSKDFFQVLAGTWLNEIGEMDSFRGADASRVKTAISTPVDRFRPSYGRSASDHPRQCVFAGTTNKDGWGNDETGLRRFWPIRCGDIDCAALARDRDQLFAEAVARFTAGESWWTMPATAADVQNARQHEHAWTERLLADMVTKSDITMNEILSDVLKLTISQQNQGGPEYVVGRILRRAGWTRHTLRRDGKQRRIWRNPTSEGTEGETF
jgi:predicted P-loop ATPase